MAKIQKFQKKRKKSSIFGISVGILKNVDLPLIINEIRRHPCEFTRFRGVVTITRYILLIQPTVLLYLLLVFDTDCLDE